MNQDGAGDFQQADDAWQAALEEALGEEPRAAELRQMSATLQQRRAGLMHELDTCDDDAQREKLRRDIARLDEQIAVLREEAEITKFVEDAVRVGIEMRKLQD